MKKLNPSKKNIIIHLGLKRFKKKYKRKFKKYSPSIFTGIEKRRKIPEFKNLEAPRNLTLQLSDVEDVLNLISKIKKYGNAGYYIKLDMSQVMKIGEGAIAMLLSVISDLERRKIYFKGDKPTAKQPKDILEKSGFFEHMKGSISEKNKISKNKILTTGNESTNQKILAPEIHSAMETIWGVNARCPALYGGIGEMMRNSCDHAFHLGSRVVWHLGISHFEDENLCKFSFVDNGLGIIKTYYQKRLIQKILHSFNDNADFLYSAFVDGIKSRTGLSWRGKGLPTIYEMYEDGIISNLVVISNNVYLDFDKKIFKTLSVPFSGTYYFWKIDKSCSASYFN